MNSTKEVGLATVSRTPGGSLITLRDVAEIREGTMQGEVDRYNMRRMVTLTANIEGEDLGRVAARVNQALQNAGEPPRGVLSPCAARSPRWSRCSTA
jgi:multidrug efflux pump subunit AcrB